jgi:predicted NAD/FAD-binding protein
MRMRIAVIGTGISGLGAAYALSKTHEVELFERDDRAGGHSNTVEHMLVVLRARRAARRADRP